MGRCRVQIKRRIQVVLRCVLLQSEHVIEGEVKQASMKQYTIVYTAIKGCLLTVDKCDCVCWCSRGCVDEREHIQPSYGYSYVVTSTADC